MRHAILALSILIVVGTAVATEPGPRTLTFEDRVAAQKAIEQVYWSHRIWPKENPAPKPPLSAVMPDERDPSEGRGLSQEIERAGEAGGIGRSPASSFKPSSIAWLAGSRDRRVLQELFDALRNDPFVIAETLARQTLAERLIRNWYANDERIHVRRVERSRRALGACSTPTA